jgi:hypothetical protein
MHLPNKKAMAERPVSLPAKVLQWVRRRPGVAALLLLGTTAAVMLLVALVWSVAGGRNYGSPIKHKTLFEGRRIPGDPKRLPPGEAKKGNP